MRDVLVINPVTQVSWVVTVTNVPAGQIIYREGGQSPSQDFSAELRHGELILLPADQNYSTSTVTDYFNANGEVHSYPVTSSSATTYAEGSPASAGLQAQIAAVIQLSGSTGAVLLPAGSYFSSYHTATIEQVSLQLYQAMTLSNPAWATSYAGKSLWKMILRTLKLNTGKTFQVCAIFENGDSACYEVHPGQPSAAEVVEGSQIDVNGNPIAGTGAGGDSLSVSYLGSNVTYSTQGMGGWVTISCAYQGGKLIECTFTTSAN